MKIARANQNRGSVTIIILIFLALMAVIIVSNNLALDHLDKNLRAIEKKQQRTKLR